MGNKPNQQGTSKPQGNTDVQQELDKNKDSTGAPAAGSTDNTAVHNGATGADIAVSDKAPEGAAIGTNDTDAPAAGTVTDANATGADTSKAGDGVDLSQVSQEKLEDAVKEVIADRGVELVERNGSVSGTDLNTGKPATLEQVVQAERGQTTSMVHIDEAAHIEVEDVKPVVALEQAPAIVPVQVAEEDAEFWTGKGLSPDSEAQMLRLKEYIDFMNPRRPMSIEKGVPQQKALYRLFMWIINTSPDAEFKPLMMLLLEQFYIHTDGVFHETAVGRFPEHLTLSKDEARTFFNLINLFKILTDEKGGKLRFKQLDMSKTLTLLITEKGKQRLAGLIEA